MTNMERTVEIAEMGQSFGQLLQGVEVKGDKLVVERNGQPIAAIVPLEIYEDWKRRQSFFSKLRDIQDRINYTPEEADSIAQEAVQAIRETAR